MCNIMILKKEEEALFFTGVNHGILERADILGETSRSDQSTPHDPLLHPSNRPPRIYRTHGKSPDMDSYTGQTHRIAIRSRAEREMPLPSLMRLN